MSTTTLGIVVNRHLPQLAKISEAQLLARVANLEAIRTRKALVSLLIGDKIQMAQLEALHATVHSENLTEGMNTKGMTAFALSSSWIPFLVELPPPLHQWLATHSLTEVKEQVINWLAALHAAHCCRFTMWRKLLPEIRQWASMHYSKYVPRQADELVEVWAEQFDRAQDLIGGATPGVLSNPFRDNDRPFLDSADVLASYLFEVRIGYFRKDDWLFIVERSRPKLLKMYKSNLDSGRWAEADIDRQMREIDSDRMNRCEADQGMWQAWKRHFPSVGLVVS